MLKTLLWIAILIVLFIVAKRLGAGLVVFGVLIGSIFLSIFMLDTFTTFETRKYVPVAFYDKTIEQPREVANGLKEKVLGVGKDSIDKVNKVGDDVDEIYGTSLHKEKDKDVKDGVIGHVELDTKEEMEKKKEEKRQQDLDKKETEKVKGSEVFVKYKDIDEELETTYQDMTERDKSIVSTMMPMLTIKYVGDEYEIWNIRGDDGIYIKRID